MLYVSFSLSLRKVEDLLFEQGYDLCNETVRLWWNRFGPLFANVQNGAVSLMRTRLQLARLSPRNFEFKP